MAAAITTTSPTTVCCSGCARPYALIDDLLRPVTIVSAEWRKADSDKPVLESWGSSTVSRQQFANMGYQPSDAWDRVVNGTEDSVGVTFTSDGGNVWHAVVSRSESSSHPTDDPTRVTHYAKVRADYTTEVRALLSSAPIATLAERLQPQRSVVLSRVLTDAIGFKENAYFRHRYVVPPYYSCGTHLYLVFSPLNWLDAHTGEANLMVETEGHNRGSGGGPSTQILCVLATLRFSIE